jgi:N-acetyl-anhydromuramyl-L-alanine amidase AmpD
MSDIQVQAALPAIPISVSVPLEPPFEIVRKLSPNFTPGRKYSPYPGIVAGVTVHIEQGHEYGTDASFATAAAQASSTYGVGRTGMTSQFVLEADTAWHCGLPPESYKDPSQFPIAPIYIKNSNPNTYMIGIEHEGWSVPMFGLPPTEFTDEQYAMSAYLIARAAARWKFVISARTIVRHGDFYRRKANLCPGPAMDMNRLIAQAMTVKGPFVPE